MSYPWQFTDVSQNRQLQLLIFTFMPCWSNCIPTSLNHTLQPPFFPTVFTPFPSSLLLLPSASFSFASPTSDNHHVFQMVLISFPTPKKCSSRSKRALEKSRMRITKRDTQDVSHASHLEDLEHVHVWFQQSLFCSKNGPPVKVWTFCYGDRHWEIRQGLWNPGCVNVHSNAWGSLWNQDKGSWILDVVLFGTLGLETLVLAQCRGRIHFRFKWCFLLSLHIWAAVQSEGFFFFLLQLMGCSLG